MGRRNACNGAHCDRARLEACPSNPATGRTAFGSRSQPTAGPAQSVRLSRAPYVKRSAPPVPPFSPFSLSRLFPADQAGSTCPAVAYPLTFSPRSAGFSFFYALRPILSPCLFSRNRARSAMGFSWGERSRRELNRSLFGGKYSEANRETRVWSIHSVTTPQEEGNHPRCTGNARKIISSQRLILFRRFNEGRDVYKTTRP